MTTSETASAPGRWRRWRIQLAIAAAGGVLTALLAALTHAPADEALVLIGVALGAAAVVGLGGATLLGRLRTATMLTHVLAVALISVAAVAGGAVAAAQAMFISGHDLGALAVILAASATVGIIAALTLTERLLAGTRAVGLAARSIGRPVDGEPEQGTEASAATTNGGGDGGASGSRELAALADELTEIRGRLEESTQRERGLERSRRELVAWVSHDLRTPLAGLRAMVEALDDGVVDDPTEVAQYLTAMRDQVDRLAGLVTDLFELSRIQSGTLRLAPARVSVADLVSDVLAGASPAAAARGVRIHGDIDGHGPEAEVSVPELQRAIHNLVDNAIRHTPPDGAVRLHVGVEGAHAVVAVHDECGGIPGDDLPQVFDVAFSGNPARTPGPRGGAGLGLSITRGIVEAHAGEVDVRNDGPGCRFTIRLPLASVPS
jgi:signal transduction histidine kinase